jgi:hypothetical protein
MRSRTPRAEPIAALPLQAAANALESQPRALSAPIVLVCAGVEYELCAGSALLGRHGDCEIVVNDPLVSRMHARIKVDAGSVLVEDLHSTNGVYLNGTRVTREAKLHAGDTLLMGTCEVAFFEGRLQTAPSSGRVPLRSNPPGPNELDLSLDGIRPVTAGAKRALHPAVPPTRRVDALDIVGGLARRSADDGHVDDAVRVLAPQLRSILRGATTGLSVSDHLLSLASGYAMDLAHWTIESVWLDYVVELHLACRRLMSRSLFLSLQRSELWLGPMNRALLAYYAESIVARTSGLDSEERSLLAMIEQLAEG